MTIEEIRKMCQESERPTTDITIWVSLEHLQGVHHLAYSRTFSEQYPVRIDVPAYRLQAPKYLRERYPHIEVCRNYGEREPFYQVQEDAFRLRAERRGENLAAFVLRGKRGVVMYAEAVGVSWQLAHERLVAKVCIMYEACKSFLELQEPK